MRLLAAVALLLALSPAWAAELPSLSILAPSPELTAHVKQVVEQSAPRLRAWTGAAPRHIRVEVATDHAAFEQRAREMGGPRWAAGLALPQRGLILLRSPRQLGSPAEFAPLLQHELVHLYLAAGLRGRQAPLWLEEGLALLLSGEGGWARTGAMTRAVLSEKMLPLAQMDKRFPAEPLQAALAYAQSYYLVTWLLNKHGEQSLRVLVSSLAQDRPLTAALYRAIGQGLAATQEAFFADMRSRFSWLAVLTASGVLWALVSLVAMVGLVLRRRRQRAAIKQGLARELGIERDQEEAAARPRRRESRGRTRVLQEAGLGGSPDPTQDNGGPGGDSEDAGRL